MQHQKNYVISLFIILCVFINFTGKMLAEILELPLWLDSFGTVLAAYACGPISGAAVGFSVNIISNFSKPAYMVYALTSISVGVIAGICAKRKMLENLFGILTTGFLVTLASVVISTPLNCIFFEGYTGNKWGDGVINIFLENDINSVLCYAAGEYYVDFLDKILILLALYAVIRISRSEKKKKKEKISVTMLLACVFLCNFMFQPVTAEAAEAVTEEYAEIDLSTWLQTVYDDENGLPGGIANTISQTEDGILWIGTYNGLYRYNGNVFQWINKFESIKNVNYLYTDDEGRLWIGTNDSGLSICINDEIANVIDENSGLPSDSIRCIAAGFNGNYYVGTSDSLAIVKLSGGLSVAGVIPEIVYAKSISVNKEGCAAVVTDDGTLFLIDGADILSKKTLGRQGEVFNCCRFDEEGFLYAGTTESKIIRYAVDGGILKENGDIDCDELVYLNSIDFMNEGYMVICANNGIGYADFKGGVHKINTNQFNSSIDHMLCDYQGNLWFTSTRLGLLKLCETPFTEIYSKLALPEVVVNTVAKWQGNYYFGTDSGLNMADGELTESIENELTKSLEGIRIRCLMTDSRDNLWLSTSSLGVWCVHKNGRITVYDGESGALGNKGRSTLELSDGTVVLAGDLGLTYVKNDTITRTIGYEDGLENPKTLCLLEQPDGTLLAGSDGNGISLIRNGEVVGMLKKQDGLSSNVILRMVSDEDGVFIVTSNSLCFMDNDGKIRVIDKFPYYNNYDVVYGGDGRLFVPGSSGIYVVDRENVLNGGDVEYILLDAGKGLRNSLTANAWNYVDENNNLFLSGDAGVSVVNMGRYDITHRSYRMLIKSFTIDNVPYSARLGRTVEIPRKASRIVILPEIVNYSTSNPYVSFYMEGFDNSPHVCLLSELSDTVYTNLPSGQYTFHLAVLDDKGGIASENTYKIVKESDIYDEDWFFAYIVFVFMLTVIYLTWMIFRTQIQKTLNIQKRELDLAKKQVEMSNEAIITIAKTVDAKDFYTSQHSYRVSEYAVMIAERLKFDKNDIEELRRTALLHDIGKIGIPDSVLNKPARLNDEEYAIMKSHVTKGAEILQGFTSAPHIVEGAKYHHERYDGRGYAGGLSGEDIPLNARIIGIADAFDAMTANRVYRKKLDFSFVVEELKKGRGTQFDPHLTDIFLELIDDGTVNVGELYGERGVENEES